MVQEGSFSSAIVNLCTVGLEVSSKWHQFGNYCESELLLQSLPSVLCVDIQFLLLKISKSLQTLILWEVRKKRKSQISCFYFYLGLWKSESLCGMGNCNLMLLRQGSAIATCPQLDYLVVHYCCYHDEWNAFCCSLKSNIIASRCVCLDYFCDFVPSLQ